jgi:hypothetical protein
VKVGLGIVTWRRPERFATCIMSVGRHLASQLGWLDVYHDGPLVEPYRNPIGQGFVVGGVNRGVAFAKNQLLSSMLAVGCDWCFVVEDDMEVTDPRAIAGYIAACEESGLQHLSFHGHGPANPAPTGIVAGPVTYWPNMVGAFCVYSRKALLQGGLLDEHFLNAHDHCEHTQRLAALGFTTEWPRNADATGSERWLREQPGSIEDSVIRSRPDWNANRVAAKQYWAKTYPDTYCKVFGP